MSSLEKKLVDEIIKLGIPNSKAKAIVKNLSADDKSRALVDSAFLHDLCQTPASPGPVPAPYPETRKSADMINDSKKVKIEANGALIEEKSSYEQSTGDEHGSARIDGSTDEIFDIDNGKRIDSIIEIDTLRNQANRLGEKINDEARRAIDYISDMGPQGYKVLAATLIIGLIAGIGVSSITCGARIRALKVELDMGSELQNGGLALDSPAGAIFGYFRVDGIEWDYEGQRFMVEITNTGPTMTLIMSIAVKRFDIDESYYSVLLKGSTGSLAVQSTGTFWWVGSEADAPSGFLESGTRYRIMVTTSTGFWSEWVEVAPPG